jgi:hypothetical protein
MGWEQEELERREAEGKRRELHYEQIKFQNAAIQKIWDLLIEKNSKLHPSLRAEVFDAPVDSSGDSEYSHMSGHGSNEYLRLKRGLPSGIEAGKTKINDYHWDLHIRFDPEKNRCVFVAETYTYQLAVHQEYRLDDEILDRIIQNLCTGNKPDHNIPVIWRRPPILPPPEKKSFLSWLFD